MSKVKVATCWLDGCSGCHMSFLDIDERILALAEKIDLVLSPLVDNKKFPEMVDVTIMEGAVATTEDVEKVHKIRRHSKVIIALGDCAVTGNVPAMRNNFGADAALRRAYLENVSSDPQIPREIIPPLLAAVRPVHEVVPVDLFIPGCPPSADLIFTVLSELLEGKVANPAAKFG